MRQISGDREWQGGDRGQYGGVEGVETGGTKKA